VALGGTTAADRHSITDLGLNVGLYIFVQVKLYFLFLNHLFGAYLNSSIV